MGSALKLPVVRAKKKPSLNHAAAGPSASDVGGPGCRQGGMKSLDCLVDRNGDSGRRSFLGTIDVVC